MDNFSNTPQQPSVSPTKKPSLFRRVVDDLKYYVDYARNSNEYSTFGKAGEQCIYRTLIEDLHIPKSQVFRNVYLRDAEGRSCEVDMVVASKHAIFVLEVKTLSGVISGSAKDTYWQHSVSGKSFKLYNPFLQVNHHAEVLRNQLPADIRDQVRIIPMVNTVVMYMRDAEYHITDLTDRDIITIPRKIPFEQKFMEVYNSLDNMPITHEQFDFICALLRTNSRPNNDVPKRHIRYAGYVARHKKHNN